MKTWSALIAGCLAVFFAAASSAQPFRLDPAAFRHYVDRFNAQDNELYPQAISNAAAWEWMARNIPWLECPDKDIELTYYFRWWTYRKHVRSTPDGFVITEFLPSVPWAGKFNTISCGAGHHFYEGRWISTPEYLDDYARFWFLKGGEPRRYSFWPADALLARHLVQPNQPLLVALLPHLVQNFEAWEKSRRDGNGLFWQNDGEDGMEVSIGGSGYRATINSYMFGEANAIARIAAMAAEPDLANRFRREAGRIKELVQTKLWDDTAGFFKVLPRGAGATLAAVRELHGLTPWYFNLPDPPFAVAWKQVLDPQGFAARIGPTTAEQRSASFSVAYTGHECQWNGPSWPYSTSVTLAGLANLLNGGNQTVIDRDGYFNLLQAYALSHRLRREDGSVVPWIDENLNPFTGDWIARTLLQQRGSAIPERGKDYNHSTFCDLVISGLIGLRPRPDEVIELNPLTPPDWDYFCLDGVRYHSRSITVLWDRTGTHYGKGKGLQVYADGQLVCAAEGIQRVTGALPSPDRSPAASQTTAGWSKYPANPVMGGQYGTCFDVAVLPEAGGYRMWLSWRPQKSLAIVDSKDGFHWSQPPRAVFGPRSETGWEDDINRPAVVKRADGYHLWYTGQARGRSSIGYATSADGVDWKRSGERPVLSPEEPWEKVAVMCPHVIWDDAARQYRMWYSGGEQNEPNAIGYATSPDGRTWTKRSSNPVFVPDPGSAWEKHKVTACQVIREGDWHLMFYIGFRDEPHAQIGLARSRDGITGWERHPSNPIVRPGEQQWDHDACYKPFAIFDGEKWLLWYNGRHGALEQIGVAVHPGLDLGFK
ncbi:MAG: hypothetical protein U1G07_17330 [Verrucomicrobiota bacterium]